MIRVGREGADKSQLSGLILDQSASAGRLEQTAELFDPSIMTAFEDNALAIHLLSKEPPMPHSDSPPTASELRKRALSRWDEDGGAIATAPQAASLDEHELTNAELVHLRIRVIALENMMIAVLAEGSDRQLKVAREMAEYMAPRPGFTPHPLTLQAADHMNSFVERSLRFRSDHG